MTKTLVVLGILMMTTSLQAQSDRKGVPLPKEIKVAIEPGSWDFQPGKVEFITHKGKSTMKLTSSTDKSVLKNLQFTDGTIEFEIEPLDQAFAGIYFRMANNSEMEYFYLRVARAGNPSAMDAVQYAPFANGVNMWDLFGQFQGPANIKKGEWNHIKLVVSGRQMVAYVNNVGTTTLEVPRLESNSLTGSLAFNGRCLITDLVIKPNEVDGLPSQEGFDPTYHDPRYIRYWQVNSPQPLPKGQELYDGEFPDAETNWQPIDAERRGLINLTRGFGDSKSRRFCWLKVKLVAVTEQKRKISLGFSDEVWVFLNRQPVFTDKNIYLSPGMRKNPDGRISTDNSSFQIDLKAGENELLVGIANDFYGWGIIALLDNMEGIAIQR